jgi:hypothetical protein
VQIKQNKRATCRVLRISASPFVAAPFALINPLAIVELLNPCTFAPPRKAPHRAADVIGGELAYEFFQLDNGIRKPL